MENIRLNVWMQREVNYFIDDVLDTVDKKDLSIYELSMNDLDADFFATKTINPHPNPRRTLSVVENELLESKMKVAEIIVSGMKDKLIDLDRKLSEVKNSLACLSPPLEKREKLTYLIQQGKLGFESNQIRKEIAAVKEELVQKENKLNELKLELARKKTNYCSPPELEEEEVIEMLDEGESSIEWTPPMQYGESLKVTLIWEGKNGLKRRDTVSEFD